MMTGAIGRTRRRTPIARGHHPQMRRGEHTHAHR